MSESESRRERGQRLFREVTTGEPVEPDDAYMQFTMDAVFGDVWSRPGLTRKERRWITLTCVGISGAPGAMKYHIEAALRSGDIAPDEMIEWCVHFAHYAGWPLSSSVYTEVRSAIAGLEASTQT